MAENSGITARRGRPFEPGRSGNPGGRPALTDAQRKARELRAQAQPDLVAVLLSIATDETADTKDRIVAAKALLDDPADLVSEPELSPVNQHLRQMSSEDLIALLDALKEPDVFDRRMTMVPGSAP